MKNNQKIHATAGFTLVELSIVLVIIGLIVGGVLVGQNLIRQAELRATVSQVEQYNTTVNTFRGRYGGIPGDLNNALRFFTQADIANGNGNGALEDADPANGWTDYDGEVAQFWGQVSEANMIDGNFEVLAAANTAAPVQRTNFPPARHGRGGVFVHNAAGFNHYHLSDHANTTQEMVRTPSFLAEEAYQIDLKMDDGQATTGSVLAVREDGSTPPVTVVEDDASTNCLEDLDGAGPGTEFDYDFTPAVDGPVCMLRIRSN